VLLNRTPYDKEELHSQAVFFAERGYVVAVQDARGRYKSEGTFSKVQPADATDGYDVVEWLAKQAYATGQVGMWGTSFAAHMQAGAVQLRPPALRALALNMGGMSNAWDHGVRFRGTYEMGRQLTWAWGQMIADAREPHVRALLEREKVEDWFSIVPYRERHSRPGAQRVAEARSGRSGRYPIPPSSSRRTRTRRARLRTRARSARHAFHDAPATTSRSRAGWPATRATTN
jgi:putative CocE/NonD family hydrolase